jgi:hypothetical protein
MVQELVKCPLCERRVYLQPPTIKPWRLFKKAAQTKFHPTDEGLAFTQDKRIEDDYDLSI